MDERLNSRTERELVLKVQRALFSYLDPQGLYVVACSGGADSLALTDAMLQAGFAMCVCHVEHGLRGAAAQADAEFVQAWCAARGVPCEVCHVRVREYAEAHQLSEEDAARQLRYRALASVLEKTGAAAVVTAHQQDDQAETVLLHLLRGSGLRGLAGMAVAGTVTIPADEAGQAPVSVQVLRPLLTLTGAALRAYCRARRLTWREDHTNAELRYTRNRVRRQLMPLLYSFNPNITEGLARLAQVARVDADFVREAALHAYDDCVCAASAVQDKLARAAVAKAMQAAVPNLRKGAQTQEATDTHRLAEIPETSPEGGTVTGVWKPQLVLDVKRWRGYAPAVQLELLRLLWENLGEPQALPLDKIQEILALAEKGHSGKKILLPKRHQIVYNYGKLVLG